MKQQMATIPTEMLTQLLKDQRMLHALEAAGVDNWSGYGDAMVMLNEEEDEEETVYVSKEPVKKKSRRKE